MSLNMAIESLCVNMSVETYSCDYYEDIVAFDNQKSHFGWRLCRLVAVSFGLLCILQAGLNISMRLSLNSSEDTSLQNMTKENEELKRTLTTFDNYSSQGWLYFRKSFYYISSLEKSWQDSRQDCLEQGADLVVINSKEEQEFTRSFRKNIWIGLTDQEKEGMWKWVDGTPVSMSYWGINEPNSHEGHDEDCGEIKFFDHQNSWNDKPCDIGNVWICEKTFTL